MATKNDEKLVFNKQEFYAAKRDLSVPAFSIWCYLASGNQYNKQAIAKLNNTSERSIERGLVTLKEKGYYINDTFYAQPRLENRKLNTSPVKIIPSSIKPVVKVESKSVVEPVQRNWINKF